MPAVPRLRDARSKARWLVDRARANGGLAPLDVERFWADQETARKDPFGPDIPQVALGIMMSGECVFDELGMPDDYWRYDHDADWRVSLNKAYNDKAEKIVGRRLLGEGKPDPSLAWPATKGLHDIFEARNEWHDRSWWLRQSAHNEDELKALLDRVERRIENLRAFILPENWETQKQRLTALGAKPPLYRTQRGPVTFATSIYGPENLVFLILDNPDLAGRLRDTILKAMLGLARVLDEEAGHTPETAPRGFAFFDDNCCLLNPAMYEMFGCPIVKAVFDRYSPDPGHSRYQHSDSAMGHLLPILGRLSFTSVNFGPTLTVAEIRRHCPMAVIEGQLAPFTFSRNQEENIVREFLRDHEMSRRKRGLLFATAGSINNGSRLTGMRLIMATIQHFGRF
jgi:uroporphyrinogen decarboxylase